MNKNKKNPEALIKVILMSNKNNISSENKELLVQRFKRINFKNCKLKCKMSLLVNRTLVRSLFICNFVKVIIISTKQESNIKSVEKLTNVDLKKVGFYLEKIYKREHIYDLVFKNENKENNEVVERIYFDKDISFSKYSTVIVSSFCCKSRFWIKNFTFKPEEELKKVTNLLEKYVKGIYGKVFRKAPTEYKQKKNVAVFEDDSL